MIKKAFFSALDFLLFSNIFIALCAVAQGLLTYWLLKAQPDKYVLLFVFCATLLIYNLSMLLSKPKNPQESPFKRVRWIFSHHRLIISITLIAALCLIPLGLWYLSLQSQLLMGFIGIIALAYNFPFLKLNEKKIGLRNLPGIKLFLIAFVWAISCVLLPIVELENTFSSITISLRETLLLVSKRFIFICAITIPFDLRDLFQDKLYELKTIPTIFGEKKTLLICQGFLVSYILLLLLFTKTFNLDVIGLAFTIFLTGWLIFKSNLKRNEYYYFFFLDGTMLLQFLIVWFLGFISR